MLNSCCQVVRVVVNWTINKVNSLLLGLTYCLNKIVNMSLDKRLINIVLLGFGFMFVFTAFQTMGNIQKTVMTSIHEDDTLFKGDGYTSLAIIYAVFALCNWLAPSVISVTGPRVAMIIGAITYAFFIASFLEPRTWLLYMASVVIGVGAAIIWTGQGNYLTLNSDSTTISRNSGIFWAMLQCSMFFGNLFVYYVFQGKTHIDAETRRILFTVLVSVSVLGIVFLLLLRRSRSADGELVAKDVTGPLHALKRSLQLITTKQMLLLAVTFLYTGLELSFFSGVYSPSIGFTLQLGDSAKQLVGLSGIFIGVGEVLGGALFGLLGHKTVRWGRDPIVILGFIIHLLSYFLIFLNLPNDSPFQDTHQEAFIKSRAWLAIACSFLLGFGDSCFNTQVFSILGIMYAEDSAPAFAIFKFTQSRGRTLLSARGREDVPEYLEQRNITELFHFLVRQLLANQPENPRAYLVALLDACMNYRADIGDAPVLYSDAHVRSVYRALDPSARGNITLAQYVTGLDTMEIAGYELCPELDYKGCVAEATFCTQAKACQERMLSSLLVEWGEGEDVDQTLPSTPAAMHTEGEDEASPETLSELSGSPMHVPHPSFTSTVEFDPYPSLATLPELDPQASSTKLGRRPSSLNLLPITESTEIVHSSFRCPP